ncbi:outer membrane lipoprotein-sorting protein [Sphingobacteriales bacterium UPWRP_1]|nr:hypothetical protein BVG80_02525 [Sphingobacteriales bacterium TSM_CSM]PSJ75229.1 outer membrane lipoprotein-sorting protein [Sphingobacteriales bacterium UPWRP_1]
MKKQLLFIILFLALAIPALMWKSSLHASLPGAKELVEKAIQNLIGNNGMQAELNIKNYNAGTEVIEIVVKTWQKTPENMLVLVTAPARDKGTAYLRKGKEVWKWQPANEKMSKLTGPEIAEKWMNTQLTIADITGYNSLADDYTASFKNLTKVNGQECYLIELIPNSEALQVWYRTDLYINSKNSIIQKAEYYDEDDYLITTATTLQTQPVTGGRTIPQLVEWLSAADETQKTTVEYKAVTYEPVPEAAFTLDYMKIAR